MQPIPESAMPVVKVLRRDVPRPTCLPTCNWDDVLRWATPRKEMCPMGLHPFSRSPVPSARWSFANGRCSGQAVYEFFHWWDYLTEADAQGALDAIWPEEA